MTINRYTLDETVNFLAQCQLNGAVFKALFNPESDIKKYITGSAYEFKRAQDLLATFLDQLDPRDTDIFLELWEKALSIPDSCIPLASNKQERRDNIVLKLASLSAQTSGDIERIAEDFGFTISTLTGDYPPYDVPFTPTDPIGGPFIWVISGNFSSNPDKAEIFQCIVRVLIPSGYKVEFVES